jgi:hypothetical protein
MPAGVSVRPITVIHGRDAAELADLRRQLATFAEWLEGRRNAPTITTIGGILQEMHDRGLLTPPGDPAQERHGDQTI